MRSPVLLGALAALVLGIGLLAIVLQMAVSDPPRPPTPGVPTPPPIALLTPTPLETAVPTATAEPVTPRPDETPAGEPSDPPDGGGGLGEPAPRLVLPQLGGGTFDTAQFAGKPMWINFMATWCPQCIDELPMMEVMQEQLGEDMALLLVDVGEDESQVRAFVDGLGVTLPVGLDSDSAAQQEWGAWALPMHVMIDGDGVMRSVIYGGPPPDVFIDAVVNVVPDADLQYGD